MMIAYGPNDVYRRDVNLDGFPDIVARTQNPSDLNPNHELYVWDPDAAGFVKVRKIGFETLAYFERGSDSLENYVSTSSRTGENQVLRWEGNALVLEPEEESEQMTLERRDSIIYYP
jgi:hypothetical protein